MTRPFTNRFRRPFAVTSCVLASVLLAACGGGESSGDSRLSETLPYSEQSSANEVPQANSGANSQANNPQANPGPSESTHTGSSLDQQANNTDSSPNVNDPVEKPNTQTPTAQKPNNPVAGDEVTDNTANDSGPNSGGSNGLIDDVIDTVENVIDEGLDVALDEALWEGPVARVKGAVTLEWFAPRVRENGDVLNDNELGGYELRYRKAGSDTFDHVVLQAGSAELDDVVLEGDWAVALKLKDLSGDYQFAVAAYDVDGLYSNFVNITPES